MLLRKQCVNKLFELLDVYAVIFYETLKYLRPHQALNYMFPLLFNITTLL